MAGCVECKDLDRAYQEALWPAVKGAGRGLVAELRFIAARDASYAHGLNHFLERRAGGPDPMPGQSIADNRTAPSAS
jgi:hypothetical protein